MDDLEHTIAVYQRMPCRVIAIDLKHCLPRLHRTHDHAAALDTPNRERQANLVAEVRGLIQGDLEPVDRKNVVTMIREETKFKR